MRKGVVALCLNPTLLFTFLVFLCSNEYTCSALNYVKSSLIMDKRSYAFLPETSPAAAPQPLLPFLAPSPLTPFTNSTVPKLSGLCLLNFPAVERIMHITSIDCMAVFAPVLAKVVCCPQLEATLVILIGQSSINTDMLALNGTTSKHCFSDFEQILMGQGANGNLQQLCSIHPSNLTEGSCPIKDVNEFESIVDSSKLIVACGKIDLMNECCEQLCQNAILEAATNLALKAYDLSSMDGSHALSDHSTRVNDCKSIVLRWLARKLDPSRAKEVLRGLSSCSINKVCPLKLPPMKNITKSCANEISNKTECCRAMENYVSHLQRQSFITNLQALNCAASLGMKLQKANITRDIYNICHISLKDFSVQAIGNQESGCLLPSLPSDATFDKSTGVSFLCDLNDNIPAPWPSSSQLSASSCNKTVKIPALPAAASGQSGIYTRNVMIILLYMVSVAFMIIM